MTTSQSGHFPPRWRRLVLAPAVLLAAAVAALPVTLAAAGPALHKHNLGDLTTTTFGAPTGNDEGRSVAVDGYGNIFVLGVTSSRFGSADVSGLDGPDDDVLLVKLSSSGRLLWRRRTGSPADDRPAGMVFVDGRLYVVGQTLGDVTAGGDGAAAADRSTSSSAFVLCYDADTARRVWARQWVPPPGGGHQSWNAVAAAASGEVWVAGHSGAGLFTVAPTGGPAAGVPPLPSGVVAVTVARLDGATGETLQGGSVAHPGGVDASAAGVVVTPDGVIAAAQTRSAVGVADGGPAVPVEDLLLVRLRLDGPLPVDAAAAVEGRPRPYPPALTQTGVRVVTTASRYFVRGAVAGPAASGLVYVVGSEFRSATSANDVSVRSYTSAGLDDGPLALVHDTSSGGGGVAGGDESATSIAVLPGGRLVVGGAVRAAERGVGSTAVTPVVWVVDPASGGLVRFTTATGAAGSGGWAEVTAVTIDADGDVVVAGYTNAGRETDVLAGVLALPANVKAHVAAGGAALPVGGGDGAALGGGLFVDGTGDGSRGGGGDGSGTARALRVAMWAVVGAAGLLGVAVLARCAIIVRRDRRYLYSGMGNGGGGGGGPAKLPGGAGLLSPRSAVADGQRGYRELYDHIDVD